VLYAALLCTCYALYQPHVAAAPLHMANRSAGCVLSLLTLAGRLAVRMNFSGKQHSVVYSSNSWPLDLGPCRWLAKHARLSNNLEVWGLFLEDCEGLLSPLRAEAIVAAGLSAAGGQHSTSSGPMTRQRANSAAAAAPQHSPAAAAAAAAAAFATARGAAAAAGPISRGQHRQGLLLQHMHSYVPSDGSLLCGLAGSTQLTHLELTIRKGATPAADCRHALASLRGRDMNCKAMHHAICLFLCCRASCSSCQVHTVTALLCWAVLLLC